MVLIPNDVGLRLRMQTDAALQPIAPVTEIPADLTELRPGQVFSARIQEVLPENTYKALVAGRTLTLALPQGAKAGDTLELVVVDRTPRLVVAQLASPGVSGDAAATADAPFTSLSRTAQLIGALLTRDGSPAPPAPLTRGQPLLAAVPANAAALAAELAPQLAKAVGVSGLFYEAHQVQWVMGQRPMTDLLAEPQAKHAAMASQPTATEEAPAAVPAENRTALGARPVLPSTPMTILQTLFGSEVARPQAAAESAAIGNPAQAVPEDLRPLVQQQLDVATSLRMAWHGEVWPGQTLDWEIQPEDRQAGTYRGESERGWITSLRLITPRLGEIDARLSLNPQGARITLATPSETSADQLRDAAPGLEKSMAAAGVPLLALLVKHGDEE